MEEIERILHVCPDETPEMVVAESAVFLAELEGILAQLHEIVDHLALVEVHDRIPAGEILQFLDGQIPAVVPPAARRLAAADIARSRDWRRNPRGRAAMRSDDSRPIGSCGTESSAVTAPLVREAAFRFRRD